MTDLAKEISDRLPVLTRYSKYLTRNEADAEDLVQDCVERAIDRQAQFQPGTNLDAWLKTIMRNIFLNKMRRDKLVRLHAGRERLTETNYAMPSQDDYLELKEVFRAMRRLSANHKRAIQLLCVDDVGYQEAARRMSVPEATAKTRLFRARERLRTQFAA